MRYIILSLFVVLLLLNNHSLCLWEQDEAAYAGFAWQMIETDSYLIPDFEWSWPHRKPPLHFWLIAASYQFFGYSEFATRIPSVAMILATLLLIYFLTRKLYNSSILANWASAVFMGSLLMPLYGKISMTDATLLFFFTITFYSILLYLKNETNIWLYLIAVGVAGGSLTKGPPIVIATMGSLAIFFIFSHKKKQLLWIVLAAVLGLTPFFIWGLLAWQNDNGVFISWLWDWYVLKRTNGVIYGQGGVVGYYLLFFLICFFSWFLFIPQAIYKMFSSYFTSNIENKSHYLFILCWIISGWLIYEFIPSKLPSYSFAVIPVWCIFIGKIIVEFKETPTILSNVFIKIWGGFLVLIGIGALLFYTKIPFPSFYFAIKILALVFILFGIAHFFSTYYISWKNRLSEVALLLAFSINYIAWGIAIPSFEPIRNFPKQIAQTILNDYTPHSNLIFSCDYSMSSLPVYLSWGGVKHQTVPKDNYEQHTLDSLKYSTTNLFMLEKRNMWCLPQVKDSIKLQLMQGWISDRGVIDTFYIAERVIR